MNTSGTARLVLPAQPDFVQVARLTFAGLATRLGFPYDEAEDIRLAVGEAMTLLIAGVAPDSVVDLRARWTTGRFEIAVLRKDGPPLVEGEEAAVAMMVIEALMEAAPLETDDPTRRGLVLSKRRAAV